MRCSPRWQPGTTSARTPTVGRSPASPRAGICSFKRGLANVGQFSRVISWIGSYASIQWKEDPHASDGGQDYPEKVLREAKRNLRVWLQDGSEDLENPRYGSWPLANLRLANALKLKDYDFHLSFGKGTHNTGHGRGRIPRGDDLAVERLRPRQNPADLRDGTGGEVQAAVSSVGYQSGDE